MIYNNKNTELLKSKLSENAGANAILAKVKKDQADRSQKLGVKKPSLVSRVIAGKQGKVLGAKTDAAGKAVENLEDKQLGVNKPTKLDNPSNIKVRDELYKNMKIKELQKLALTDKNAKQFMITNKLGV